MWKSLDWRIALNKSVNKEKQISAKNPENVIHHFLSARAVCCTPWCRHKLVPWFFWRGQQRSPTPVVLNPHHPPEQRFLLSPEVCASLWCSGLGRVCTAAGATQAGLSEGCPRSYSSFPTFPAFQGCSAALWLLHRKPVWRRARGDPAQAFCSLPELGAASIPPLLPVPLSSHCTVSPEVICPSDLEVEQGMASHSPEVPGLHPTQGAASTWVKLGRRIAFQVRNATEAKKCNFSGIIVPRQSCPALPDWGFWLMHVGLVQPDLLGVGFGHSSTPPLALSPPSKPRAGNFCVSLMEQMSAWWFLAHIYTCCEHTNPNGSAFDLSWIRQSWST